MTSLNRQQYKICSLRFSLNMEMRGRSRWKFPNCAENQESVTNVSSLRDEEKFKVRIKALTVWVSANVIINQLLLIRLIECLQILNASRVQMQICQLINQYNAFPLFFCCFVFKALFLVFITYRLFSSLHTSNSFRRNCLRFLHVLAFTQVPGFHRSSSYVFLSGFWFTPLI